MKEVNSSNIKSIGYNLETKTLFVHFHKGDRYQYHEVSPETYAAFESAESVGRYHNKFIKGVYKFTKEVL